MTQTGQMNTFNNQYNTLQLAHIYNIRHVDVIRAINKVFKQLNEYNIIQVDLVAKNGLLVAGFEFDDETWWVIHTICFSGPKAVASFLEYKRKIKI